MVPFTEKTPSRDYALARQRLRSRERYEPAPRGRGPEKLKGIRQLLERLGDPARGLRVVHVAGTNGKGTTATMVAALLHGAGRRVGLYTSPHLRDIRERVMVNGAMISRANFAEVTHQVLDMAEQGGGSEYLSYFDLLTAIGLLAFRRAGVEWAVLEVGLGGRSDATNTTDKELCILTPIGLDHMQVLGHDPLAIAAEKLGIVPPGVPTVVAGQTPHIQQWLAARLAENGSPLIAAFPPPLPVDLEPSARPVLECAGAALAAADALLGKAAPPELRERTRRALAAAPPGRLDYREGVTLREGAGEAFPRVLLDGGHNQGALQALHEEVRRRSLSPYTLVFSLQRDKLEEGVGQAAAPLFQGAERILVPAPQTPRTATAPELSRWARKFQGGEACPEFVETAGIRAALWAAAGVPAQPLVVAGSFWMLGDAMKLLALPATAEADAWPPQPE